jgi:hypothetical protein
LNNTAAAEKEPVGGVCTFYRQLLGYLARDLWAQCTLGRGRAEKPARRVSLALFLRLAFKKIKLEGKILNLKIEEFF